MDETGAYYTEWSKPERKTPIQYTNAYIWNLERWVTMILHAGQQRRHICKDVKNRLLDSVGEDEGGMIWENSTETCTLPYVKQMRVPCMKQGTQSQCSGTSQRDGMGREVAGIEGRRVHLYTYGKFRLTYGKKPTQYCNFPPIKINKYLFIKENNQSKQL